MKKILFFLVSALVAASASAEYPEKPVRVIMPFSAGGAGDFIIRAVQQAMEKRLGRPFVIEYKLGAGGNIGTQEVVKSAPDGYTLLIGPTNNFVINQYLFANLGFDPLQALAPITILAETPYLLLTNATVPAGTFGEFSTYAKANLGKLNYGSAGNATVPHLSAYMLAEALGWQMQHVPYRGSQPATQGLATNDVQLFITSYSTASPFMSSGKFKPLLVTSPERLKVLPSVPTAAELKIPAGIMYSNWWGIAAPRGTEPAIVNRLYQDFRGALSDPDVQKKYADQGMIAVGNTPAQFAELMQSEARVWKSIIEKTGAKVDN